MDAFWGITLSFLVIRWFWKRESRRNPSDVTPRELKEFRAKSINPSKKAKVDQRQKEYDDLKRQGYDDELIAVILPTINNGQ